MIEIALPNFPEKKLVFALNTTYKDNAYFLLSQNIPILEVVEYMTDKTIGVNGKTTLFTNGLVFIRMYYFDNSIRRISILMHEIIHAAKRIVGDDAGEESEAYMAEYIFEQMMIRLKPKIDYQEEERNWRWFNAVTKGEA